jgi:hypothetical protein
MVVAGKTHDVEEAPSQRDGVVKVRGCGPVTLCCVQDCTLGVLVVALLALRKLSAHGLTGSRMSFGPLSLLSNLT